jgi:hypothetical protein
MVYCNLKYSIRTGSGPKHQRIQRVMEALSSRVKWSGCEADHSNPSTTEVENVWSHNSAPPYALTEGTRTTIYRVRETGYSHRCVDEVSRLLAHNGSFISRGSLFLDYTEKGGSKLFRSVGTYLSITRRHIPEGWTRFIQEHFWRSLCDFLYVSSFDVRDHVPWKRTILEAEGHLFYLDISRFYGRLNANLNENNVFHHLTPPFSSIIFDIIFHTCVKKLFEHKLHAIIELLIYVFI